jgi:hypothetical protein
MEDNIIYSKIQTKEGCFNPPCGCVTWAWSNDYGWQLEQPVCGPGGCVPGPQPDRPGAYEPEFVDVQCVPP